MSTTGKIMYKWVTFQQAMFDYRRVPKIYIRYIRYYLASKISHTLRLNTHVLYIISLNLVQCGHIYTYSDVCPHLCILYSIFSVLPYAMTIYIYIILWSGDCDGDGQVQFHILFWTKSVVCGCIYLSFTILYPILCTIYNMYLYIYKVGGFKYFLFSISYMGWYPSHWRTPSFFKLVKTTNQIYMENPAFINQVLGRLVVKAWPWDHPSLLVLKSRDAPYVSH